MGNDSPPVKSPPAETDPATPRKPAKTAENNAENNSAKPLSSPSASASCQFAKRHLQVYE
jgi:hypothetical protein